jgi:EPS-associated MarR family transcriptional regulator
MNDDELAKSKEDASFRIMRLIEQNPNLTQRELANATGISLGRVHYVLRALIGSGLVKLERFSASKHKRDYAYALTPQGITEKASIAGQFLARKRIEYEALKQEIEELSDELATEVER